MAGSVSGDKDVYDEINITPMLDLAYVLLVIFIIMTTATVQGIKVNLPKASAQPSLAENKTKAITIAADGTIYLDTFPVTMSELENTLRQYKAANPNFVDIAARDVFRHREIASVADPVPSTKGLFVGESVTGPGIPAGTSIQRNLSHGYLHWAMRSRF